MNDVVDHTVQRHHVGPSPVANLVDDRQFVRPNRRVDYGVIAQAAGLKGFDKRLLRFEKVNIRIPKRIVGIEDQVEPTINETAPHAMSLKQSGRFIQLPFGVNP